MMAICFILAGCVFEHRNISESEDHIEDPYFLDNGEQGTGKTVFSHMIRALIDPNAAPIRAAPREERDLMISASNSWLLAFDNLSTIVASFADGLCRLSSGAGLAIRALHTDRDEVIFSAARPILPGIPSLTDRADLADRAVNIHLSVLTDRQRRSERDLFGAFEARRPFILGALLDAVSAALRNIGQIRLDPAPRMADFAEWVTAAEPGLNWKPGTFLGVYTNNRRDVVKSAFEADPVAIAIRDFMLDHPEGWTGTATALLAALGAKVAEGVTKGRQWPDTPQKLGIRIDRAAPLLRSKEFVVRRTHSGERLITIRPPKGN